MSIRTRLLILVLAVWLPAASGFGVFAWRTYEREVRQAQDQVEQIALGINSALERELDKRAVLGRTLAASRAVRDGDFARFHEEASEATKGTGDWAIVVGPSDHIAHTLVPFSGTRLPRAIASPLTDGAPFVLFIPKGTIVQKPVISIFSGVPGMTPQQYNVGVSFEPSVVQALLTKFAVPLGGVTAIIEHQHLVMARSRDPEKWLGISASADIKQRVTQGRSGFAPSTTLDGISSLSYVSSSNRYGWAVIIGVPKAALAATATRVTTQALSAAGVLLLIGLALALYGAQGLSNVVRALRRAASEVGDGRLPPKLRTGILEVDEVGAALREAGAKVLEVNQNLERRVAQAVEQAEHAQAKLLEGQRHEVIGRLTGGIAHDFNNLLQTVSTAHHLLRPHVPEGPQRKALQGAVRATSKAGDLVKQLLTFGRAQQLEPMAVNLGDVVLKSQELTSKAVGERIVLTASIEPGLPALFVDPMQFELALLNLVFNARDAIPETGRIVIHGRLATADEAAHLGEGPFVRLEVSDDGVGMTQAIRARVFEPYFTTKPVGAGTGLGLAQVHAFARQSGGDIELSSAPGHGTTVCLTFPTSATNAMVPLEERPPEAKPRRALSILMVEDDVLVSSLVVSALEGEGHRVHLCPTADEALAVLNGPAAFDILFTDVVMPGSMNGMELVAWCRAHRPTLPALVATGYAENLSDVPVTVLRKPYDLDALLDAFQEAHSEHAM